MIEFRKRKIQKIGGSLWVSLPFEWAKHSSLQKGSKLNAMLSEDGKFLILKPEGIE